MQLFDNIPVWGSPVDEGALRQIKTCYYIFGQAAMMADHHKVEFVTANGSTQGLCSCWLVQGSDTHINCTFIRRIAFLLISGRYSHRSGYSMEGFFDQTYRRAAWSALITLNLTLVAVGVV